jgi:hypothetical protein
MPDNRVSSTKPPTTDVPGKTPWGWGMCRHPRTAELHAIPYWDLHSHYLDDQCWCAPVLDEEGFSRHNAADRRELYEQGVARPH